MYTVQDKEQIIIGTIINCNREIKNFLNESASAMKKKHLKKLFESNNFDIYHYNMLNLYSEVTGIPFINLNEGMEFPTAVTNSRNNYYAYFQKVNDFLNGFEINLQESLNESLNVDTVRVKNPIQLNITTFKEELKSIINILDKQNDVVNYSKDILKIKAFAKQPLFVNGYNICSNISLMKELQEKFGILHQNLMAICFNQNTKQLYFVTNSTNKLVVYDLKKDVLDYYNNVNPKIEVKQLEGKTYLDTLKKLTGINAILELYLNPLVLNLKFEDNLYHDIAYNNFRMKYANSKNIVK
jgi:hypothetical protein